MGHIRLESRRGSPDVGARVGDVLDDGHQRDAVRGRSAQEDEGDVAWGGRLPGDGVGLADGDLLVQARVDDRVARGRVGVVGLGVGVDEADACREGGDDGEAHFVFG